MEFPGPTKTGFSNRKVELSVRLRIWVDECAVSQEMCILNNSVKEYENESKIFAANN